MMISCVYAEESIQEIDVVLNGYNLESTEEMYPFLNINNQLYMPLSHDITQALGFSVEITDVITLKEETTAVLYSPKKNNHPKEMTVNKSSKMISLNGSKVLNALYVYNNIYYIEVNEQLMTELNITFKEDKFLVDESKVVLPESVIKTFEFSPKSKDVYIIDNYLKITERYGLDIDFLAKSNPDFDGKYFDMNIYVYDKYDRIQDRYSAGSGLYYKPQIGRKYYEIPSDRQFSYESDTDKIKVEVEFFEPAVYAFINETTYKKIEFEIVDNISYSDLKGYSVYFISLKNVHFLSGDTDYLKRRIVQAVYPNFDSEDRHFNLKLEEMPQYKLLSNLKGLSTAYQGYDVNEGNSTSRMTGQVAVLMDASNRITKILVDKKLSEGIFKQW